MTKSFIGVLFGILVLAAMIWAAQPGSENETVNSPEGPAGALEARESSFDFGTISMANGIVSHSFAVKNSGAGPVTIGKVYTSCMCTVATLMRGDRKFGPYGMAGHGFIPKINETLNMGEEVEIEVVFDPAAHGPAGVGRIQRAVTIENSAGEPLVVGFTAMVTP